MTDESGDYGTSDNPKLVEAEGRGDNVRSVFGRPSPEPELVDGGYLPLPGTTEVTSHWDEEGASQRPMVDSRGGPRFTRRVGDDRQIAASNPRYDIPLVEPTGDFRPIRRRNAGNGTKTNGQSGATAEDRRNMAKGLASLFNGASAEASSGTTTPREVSNGSADDGLMRRDTDSDARLSARLQPDETTERRAAAPSPETAPPHNDSIGTPRPARENPYAAPAQEPGVSAKTNDSLKIEAYHDEVGSLQEQLRHALAEVEFWRRGSLLAFFMAVGAALVVFWPF